MNNCNVYLHCIKHQLYTDISISQIDEKLQENKNISAVKWLVIYKKNLTVKHSYIYKHWNYAVKYQYYVYICVQNANDILANITGKLPVMVLDREWFYQPYHLIIVTILH